jgi:hypothetical protein
MKNLLVPCLWTDIVRVTRVDVCWSQTDAGVADFVNSKYSKELTNG